MSRSKTRQATIDAIRRMWDAGDPVKVIIYKTGVAQGTVKKYTRDLKRRYTPRGSKADEVDA